MELSVEDLERYKKRLERRINRNKKRIESYRLKEDSLSVHGFWSLGYFEGINGVLEDLLDDVNDLLDSSDDIIDSVHDSLGDILNNR